MRNHLSYISSALNSCTDIGPLRLLVVIYASFIIEPIARILYHIYIRDMGPSLPPSLPPSLLPSPPFLPISLPPDAGAQRQFYLYAQFIGDENFSDNAVLELQKFKIARLKRGHNRITSLSSQKGKQQRE
jgi:hypothetical protein